MSRHATKAKLLQRIDDLNAYLRHMVGRCHADSDDYCMWKECPQLRNGEPGKTGRHCPLDRRGEDDE